MKTPKSELLNTTTTMAIAGLVLIIVGIYDSFPSLIAFGVVLGALGTWVNYSL